MEEKEVEALFVAALKHVCGEDGLPTRLPFNVSKLSDRGSAQSQGIVTDVGAFLNAVACELGVAAPKA